MRGLLADCVKSQEAKFHKKNVKTDETCGSLQCLNGRRGLNLINMDLRTSLRGPIIICGDP